MLGSTEWVETHADELKAHAAVYINTDTNDRGYFFAGGSHTLEGFVNGVERDVWDPESKVSVFERNKALAAVSAIDGDAGEDADAVESATADLHIAALGSGSDFTPFLQHLGVASLNVGYGGEDDGGIYHSIYDDFYWYTHFSDTSFVYGKSMSQTVGIAMMRLADADVLPFGFNTLSATARRYTKQLQALRGTRAAKIAERNQAIASGYYAMTNDPRDPSSAPPVQVRSA